ncbi:hypothetical protein ACT1UG_29170 [Bacillus paramycoides]
MASNLLLGITIHYYIANPDLETVLDADHWAREYANELLIRK